MIRHSSGMSAQNQVGRKDEVSPLVSAFQLNGNKPHQGTVGDLSSKSAGPAAKKVVVSAARPGGGSF